MYRKSGYKKTYFIAHKPLCLASANGSSNIMKFLLNEGV